MKPRRSILSVPGNNKKMHKKASSCKADVIMLDLEDSVPPGAKEKARSIVIDSLLSLDWGDRIVTVRINGLDTSFAYRDLLSVSESAGHMLDSVVIPKVDHSADINFADRMLNGIELHKKFSNKIGIEAIIESAEGLENISDIAKASNRLKTLVFGVADYSASVGAKLVSISGHGEKEEDLYPGHRWNFAISRLVMAAKANGLIAIDSPYGNFIDTEGLKRSAVTACALGCDGKWAIHPNQLDVINQVFTPSKEDINRAGKILKAYREAEKQGLGAASVNGHMIDKATFRLAKQVWKQAEYLGLIKKL